LLFQKASYESISLRLVVLPCCISHVVSAQQNWHGFRKLETFKQQWCTLLTLYITLRFSISPLLSEVQDDLRLSKQQIWSSSISAVSGTIVMRFLLGPFCDKYGPRIPMGIILFVSAVPTAMTGLVQNATGLTVLRFFIGIGGSTFVMAQYWYVALCI
jgi:NNP family nitrate/nitrite transporter-like MFS transporter